MPPPGKKRQSKPELPEKETEIFSVLVERKCPACDTEPGNQRTIRGSEMNCYFCEDTGIIQDKVGLAELDAAIRAHKK